MFCKHCGKKLPDNSRFCSGCGANLSGEATHAITQPQINPPKPEKRKVDYKDYLSEAKRIDMISMIFAVSAIILSVVLFFVPLFLTNSMPIGSNPLDYDLATGEKSFSIFEELCVFSSAAQSGLDMNWWGNFEFILAIIPIFALFIWGIYTFIHSLWLFLNNNKSALVKISVLRKPRTQERASVIGGLIIFIFCLILDVSLLKDSSSYFATRYMSGLCGISAWVLVHLLFMGVAITLYVFKCKEENKVKKSIKEFEEKQI